MNHAKILNINNGNIGRTLFAGTFEECEEQLQEIIDAMEREMPICFLDHPIFEEPGEDLRLVERGLGAWPND